MFHQVTPCRNSYDRLVPLLVNEKVQINLILLKSLPTKDKIFHIPSNSTHITIIVLLQTFT